MPEARSAVLASALCLAFAGAAVPPPAVAAHAQPAQARAARPPSDEVLKTRVESALRAAGDIPGKAIAVVASRGVVHLSGTVANTTELQSLGAVVRAVPAVRDVRFSVKVQPPAADPPR